MGCPERIELSRPAPQAGVLPLNYGHHELLLLTFVMVDEVVAIMAKPDEIINLVVLPVLIEMMHREHAFIFRSTQFAHLRNLVP